ncbi:MAG: NitT/TauT family transport system ATP-binding protein [Chthoniobacter sp.]|nr:NitT/TauT family transport system ATP-binding protein [Chthoniobacter sp.]
MLQVRNLEKIFFSRKGRTQALTPTTFDIAAGEFVCLVGASGCGKSTLLNMIAGLEEPTAGEILVDGQLVTGPGQDRGMVFQHYTLFPWLTVLQNTEFSEQLECNLDYDTLTSGEVEERSGRAESLLEVMGLADFHQSFPRELSGGMKQRVAIARALVNRPKLLLMDEPFGALDAQTREDMQEMMLLLSSTEKISVLFVTHDLEEAVYLASRILVFSPRPGRLVADLKVPYLIERPATLKVHPDFLAIKRQLVDMLESSKVEGQKWDRDALLRKLTRETTQA